MKAEKVVVITEKGEHGEKFWSDCSGDQNPQKKKKEGP